MTWVAMIAKAAFRVCRPKRPEYPGGIAPLGIVKTISRLNSTQPLKTCKNACRAPYPSKSFLIVVVHYFVCKLLHMDWGCCTV